MLTEGITHKEPVSRILAKFFYQTDSRSYRQTE